MSELRSDRLKQIQEATQQPGFTPSSFYGFVGFDDLIWLISRAEQFEAVLNRPVNIAVKALVDDNEKLQALVQQADALFKEMAGSRPEFFWLKHRREIGEINNDYLKPPRII